MSENCGKVNIEVNVDELKNRLWNHHENHAQGKTMDYSSVVSDCKFAADEIEVMQSKVEGLEQEQQCVLKRLEEQDYRNNRLRSENHTLKECVIKMCLERYMQ